jgi:hypothetical protein
LPGFKPAPPPPPPTTTADTDVTPDGTTKVYVPTVANNSEPEFGVVMLLLAALAALVPIALVAVTVNVYAVLPVNPVTLIVPEPAVARVPVPPLGVDVAV